VEEGRIYQEARAPAVLLQDFPLLSEGPQIVRIGAAAVPDSIVASPCPGAHPPTGQISLTVDEEPSDPRYSLTYGHQTLHLLPAVLFTTSFERLPPPFPVGQPPPWGLRFKFPLVLSHLNERAFAFPHGPGRRPCLPRVFCRPPGRSGTKTHPPCLCRDVLPLSSAVR